MKGYRSLLAPLLRERQEAAACGYGGAFERKYDRAYYETDEAEGRVHDHKDPGARRPHELRFSDRPGELLAPHSRYSGHRGGRTHREGTGSQGLGREGR